MIAIAWTDPARTDLESIDDHLTAIDLALASTIIDRIEAGGCFLQSTPAAGSIAALDGIRKCSVRKTRYLLIYRIVADSVEILRIRHDREDWLP